MADNDTAKNASGSTVTYASDDIGGVKVPRVKVQWGVDGSVVDASATDPLPVEIAAGTFELSQAVGDVIRVGGVGKIIQTTNAVTAGSYSSGDVLGGKITLTSAMRATDATGMLQSLLIHTEDGEAFDGDILIFGTNPTASISDNGAWVWNSTDFAKLQGHVHVLASDFTTIGGDGIANLTNLGILVQATSAAHIYAYVICTGTPTFAATTDLNITWSFYQD